MFFLMIFPFILCILLWKQTPRTVVEGKSECEPKIREE